MAWCSIQKKLRIFKHPSFIVDGGAKIHPTQKPVALYAWILDKYAQQGDKIFDPFLGSGSSRIASYKRGFDFYGCELNEEYYDAQDERFRRICLGEYTSNGKQLNKLNYLNYDNNYLNHSIYGNINLLLL